jgi:hypothetical protein
LNRVKTARRRNGDGSSVAAGVKPFFPPKDDLNPIGAERPAVRYGVSRPGRID